MPRHCSAAGCNSRDTREARKSGLTFHRLPKRGNPRRVTWILNSLRKGPEGKGLWDPQSDYIYFCSKHFTPDSFELSGVSGYRRLKDDAVPTVVETLPFQKRKASRGRGRPRNVERQMSGYQKLESDAVEILPHQNHKASRRRGRPRKVVRQMRISADAVTPESMEVQINEASVQNMISGEEVDISKPAPGEQDTDQTPVPNLSEDLYSDNQKSPHDPQANLASNPPSPRPPSPSRYMRRLPPPLGFYLPKEHNYAQLCPLVWRKRYDKAIDNLEKALRLLSAARRRENRLRLALLRLRESRLKNTLSRIQDGNRRKDSHGGCGKTCSLGTQCVKNAKPDKSATLEGTDESEIDGSNEDVELFTVESWRRQESNTVKERSTVEEEEGCCFYCGRGKEDEESKEDKAKEVQDALGNSKPKRMQEGKRNKWTSKLLGDRRVRSAKNDAKDSYLYYSENTASEDQAKTLQQPHVDAETSPELCGKPLQQLTLLHPQTEVLLQMHAISGQTQPTVMLQEASSPLQLQQLHLLPPNLGLQPGLLLPDLTTAEGNLTQNEPDRGNHIYLVEERADSHVLLLPLSAETRERSEISVDGVLHNMETQSILVAEEDLYHGAGEEGGGGGGCCSGVESDLIGLKNIALRKDSQNSHQTKMRTAVVSGDVRQKLKEHLEGFHLQLSNEFVD